MWLSGAQTRPACALSCWITCFKAGLLCLALEMSYRNRNCVEAPVSIVATGLEGSGLGLGTYSEFIPAVRIARVLPSGLTTAFTASPATKFG